MKPRLLALIVPALAACSLTEVPPPPGSIAINECGEKDCTCFRDACVVGSTEIEDILIEITPPATAGSMAGLAFYTELPDMKDEDLVIGHVAEVTGSVTPSVETDCVFEGPLPDKLAYGVSSGTIPVGLTFTPSASVLGVATAAYPSIAPTLGWMDGEEYQFKANLPPGEYDLYLEPRPPAGDQPGCKFPPYLLRGQKVSVSSTLAVQFPERKSLALTIRLPVGDRSIAGWTVDMLDSRSGRVLSTREIVTASPDTSDAAEYQATLVFIPAHVFGEDGEITVDPYPVEGSEIIRLSPPENEVAPSFLFQRNALSINDPAVGVIDLRSPESNSIPTSAFPTNVTVEGQTALTGTGAPVEATVTLNASAFEGSDTPAFFVHTVEVGPTGRFSILKLPAGTYQVRATPKPGSGLAAAETEWQIRSVPSQDVVAGKLIELPPASRLSGSVTISQVGGAPFGASASALVSPLAVQTKVLDLARGTLPALPSASTDIVSKNGGFQLLADPGTYDVFIRPEARSRYPWFVMPAVEVPPDRLNLGTVRLSLPVIYHGNVTVEDGDDTKANATVPGALVRAYAYVTGEPTPDGVVPTGVIPVAEARADENGAFELLIPASLDRGQ